MGSGALHPPAACRHRRDVPSRCTPLWFAAPLTRVVVVPFQPSCQFPPSSPSPGFWPWRVPCDQAHGPPVFPSRTLLWFIGPGFLTTTGSSDSLQTPRPLFDVFAACPALRVRCKVSLDHLGGLPLCPGHPNLARPCIGFWVGPATQAHPPDPATLVTSRSGQRFGFRPPAPHLMVTHCLSPTASRQPGAVWTLTMQPSRLRGVQNNQLLKLVLTQLLNTHFIRLCRSAHTTACARSWTPINS